MSGVDGDKAVKLLISGRVQGVWYRASTATKARELQLRGWVRNLDDGRVEAFAQGPGRDVDALIRWCHDGPPMARVQEVCVEQATVSDAPHGFDVIRGRF